MGWLTPLEHTTVDWRFQARGPLESEARAFYVNRDAFTSSVLGEEFRLAPPAADWDGRFVMRTK